MDKILLIGEESGFFKNLKDALSDDFRVVTCGINYTLIRRVIQMNQTRIAICIKPENMNATAVKEINDAFPKMTLIVICEEKDDSMKWFSGEKQICLNKPLKIKALKEDMAVILSEPEEVEDNRKRVLAVDDNGLVLRTIKQVLEDEFVVEFANSGIKALDMLKKNPYDVCLLDYEMPIVNGLEVFKAIQNRYPTLPVIFLTGVSDRKRIEEVAIHHPAGYVLKPIEAERIKEKIHKALA